MPSAFVSIDDNYTTESRQISYFWSTKSYFCCFLENVDPTLILLFTPPPRLQCMDLVILPKTSHSRVTTGSPLPLSQENRGRGEIEDLLIADCHVHVHSYSILYIGRTTHCSVLNTWDKWASSVHVDLS